MACFHPIKGFQGKDGKVRFNDYSGTPMTIACGQCRGCRLETSRQWAVRIMHEAQMHPRNCWITLTYNNTFLPQDRSLDKSHFQKFMKRLRARADHPIRYYHCGEYGDENDRPHYHACIFGEDFDFDRTPWRTSNGNQLYRSKTLESLWTFGNSEIGSLTQQSAGYTARYIMKKVNGKKQDSHYLDKATGVIRIPPYTTMSTRPGIGRAWIEKYHSEVFPLDEVISNGHRTRPPKYYDQFNKNRDEFAHEQIIKRRKEKGDLHKDDNTAERLKVKEIVLAAQTSTLKRNL